MTVPEWTSFHSIAKVLGDSAEEFLQPRSAQGIENIQKLIFKGSKTKEYIPPVSLIRSNLTYAFDFVVDGLDECMKAGWALGLAVHERASDTSAEREHIQDRDDGSEILWTSIFQGETNSAPLPSRENMRSCGYVFWDEARLIKWGLLNEPSRDVRVAQVLTQSRNEPPTRDERMEWNVKEFIALGRLELFLW